ncbi:uncharacterized protein LOC116257982 isoform X2 [Nymphaea colorata]|uniref:uncharacterized protein LOC116257982 isoform X2 n=1 Tax=Nymphaea colorata TaxID=210225 RepID=UPI00129E7BA7|nr:uncharacterized protein LOC116257982 isoform X2 [Nymphaea colorata]
MDSWRYEDDEEADEYDEEDDDLFRQDLEALKRACMLTGGGDEYEAAAPDRVAESGTESEEIDDMEFLRSIQKKLCLPIDVSARTSDGSSDLVEDDFETLRAIECRFAKYDDDEAKKKESSSMQHGSDSVRVELQTNGDASLQSVIGSSSTVSTPLTLGSADVFGLEDHSTSARGHGPEGDELPSSSVAPLTKSHFSDSVRVFIEAVKKNRLCQQFIRSKLTQIETMLSENKELINRAKCLVDLQIACKRQATRFLRQESGARVRLISLPDARKQSRNLQEEKISPLFFGPRENSHVPFFRKMLSKFPSALKRRPWSSMERENLAKGVKQQIQEFLLCNSMELLCGSEEDFNQPNLLDTAVADISNLNISPEHIKSFLPQVDWNRLASMYLKDRSGAECRARWLNTEDPLINHSPWSKSDDKQLLFIVQQGGPYNWIHVAELLGINRTASQCLSRYQRSLNVNILRGDWTEEEDVQLRAAVEACGENDWQLVASHLEGRTGVQCSNRWRKCLHPSKERFGRWTVEEDKRLKIAVTLFGPGAWKKICGFIPGRTQVQCRERWIHSLDPSLRLDVWTEEEDMKLKAAIAECGKKWAKVAARIPGRTNGQCRRRWKVLFPDEVSLAQKALKIKKSALISNFVSRSKDRPALGPDDFLPVQGDAETVDAKNANVGKSKKRGSRSKEKMKEVVRSDDPQPVRCRKSRKKSVKATTETPDDDQTLSISKSHKKVEKKVNLTGRELVLYQGPNKRFLEAADDNETSVTYKLHKRVKKRREKPTGTQIILQGHTGTFTCDNGGNPKEDGRTQLNEGDAAPHSMDDRVGVHDGHCEASENQFLQKAQSLETGEAASCGSRNRPPLMRKNNSKQGNFGLADLLLEQVIAPKVICELPSAIDVGGSDFVKNAQVIYSCDWENDEDALLVTSSGCDVGISVAGIERTHNADGIIAMQMHNADGIIDMQAERINPDASDCMNCLPPSHGTNAFCEEVFDDGIPDHVTFPESSLIGTVFSRSSSDLNAIGFNAPASLEDGCIQLEDNTCFEKGENVGLSDSHNLEGEQLEAVICEGIKSNGVQKQLNGEPVALVKHSGFLEHGKKNARSLPRARRASRRNVSGKSDLCIQLEDNTCAGKNVGLPDSHNLEGEGLEAVLCEGIGSNGLQKQLIGEPAVVKDSGFLEHGKENGGSLLRAKRASRRNVNYRDMVNGNFDLCIQMEDNTCAEKGENVGLLDSHNLEGAQLEAVLCEGVKSSGVQKQLIGEPAFVKDSGFLEHGKENGGSLPRARRASRRNVKYKDMVSAKFDLCIQPEDNRCAEKGENVGLLDSHNLEGESNGVQKQLNGGPAFVKDSGFLEHGKESGGSLPRARRASRKNVNYSDMVSGNFDLFSGR